MPFKKPDLTPEETQRMAQRVLLFSRRLISQQIPLLLAPIYALREEPLPVPGPMATNGVTLFYSPEQVIDDFRRDRDAPARQLLHATLHCLLGHLGPPPPGCEDFYSDLADWKVSQLMESFSEQLSDWNTLGSFDRPLPALCRSFREDPGLQEILARQASRQEIRLDSHALWGLPLALEQQAPGSGGQEDSQGDGQEADPSQEGTAEGQGEPPPDWKGMFQELNRQAQNSPLWSRTAGLLKQEYFPAEDNGIRYDQFLRRFAMPEERLLLDPDTFDLRWYCLGLELYAGTPILEPAEISEPPAPDGLVIALDTSGSCDGDVCRRFLRETLSLLRDISAGAGRFHVCCLQCDTEIQRELFLETQEDVDTFLEHFTPQGFGGTDFRPVFERVEELREEGTLPRVRGLLYLSDGYGTFPEGPPDYPVVFLMDGQDCAPCLPDWVTALVFDAGDFTIKEASV